MNKPIEDFADQGYLGIAYSIESCGLLLLPGCCHSLVLLASGLTRRLVTRQNGSYDLQVESGQVR
ncbi:MAG: hypothetical protein H6R25_1589 [Proteobacteria bacterium]|nr:hypothetical protein [Pseudomonadota bacterium]